MSGAYAADKFSANRISRAPAALCENFFDDFAFHVGEPSIDPVMIKRELLVIQTQNMKDRCVKIRDRYFVLSDKITNFVTGAMTIAFLDSRAGEKTSERSRMMVAAR